MSAAAWSLVLIVVGVGPQPDPASARKAFDEAAALFQKTQNEPALAAYERAIALDAAPPEYHLGRCRALARLQRHAEAVQSCSDAIARKADYAEALLDRGHFLLNARQLTRAFPDLQRARTLGADPYGVAYHLALAHYLAGDFQHAAIEYEACVTHAKTAENTMACSAWQYASLVRAGRRDEAAKVLDRATPDLQLSGSAAYLDRLLLFKGVKTEEQVAEAMAKDTLQLPTVAYGVGLWHLVNGREARAREYFTKATSPPANQGAFGAVAAFYELERMKGK